MAPPPGKRLGRPKDADSAETRLRLIREARQIFALKGYGATTNKDIAASVGITPGAIYHYVLSKSELYVEVYEEVQSQVADVFAKALVGKVGLLDSMTAVLDAAVDLNEQDPSLAGFLFGVSRDVRHHPDLRHLFRSRGMATVQLIRGLVEDAVASGEILPDQLRPVEDMLGAVLNGLVRFSNLIGDNERHSRSVEMLKLMLAGTLIRPVTPPADQPAG
jgi:AcrR family transcriptional regulator